MAATFEAARISSCSSFTKHDNLNLFSHRLSLNKSPNLRFVVAMSTKKNPKRLKYATPSFTKMNGVDGTDGCIGPTVIFPHYKKEDKLLYIEADPSGDENWKLEPVIQLLKEGAVGVIPTDTVYAIVCDLKNQEAIERLRRIKNIEPSKPLSILCSSLRDIDTYSTGLSCQGHTNIFRAVKHCLPGPYTFILTASKELPKACIRYGTPKARLASRKNVGIRVPDDAICQAILQKLEIPLISTSVKCPNKNQWLLDPVEIAEIYGAEGLDFVVAGGLRLAEPSTVVDMTGSYAKMIRQGKGPKLDWMESEDDEDFIEYEDGRNSYAV